MNKLKRLVKLTKGIKILQSVLNKYLDEYSKDNQIKMEKLLEMINLIVNEELKSPRNI